jgi:hypothetical protein
MFTLGKGWVSTFMAVWPKINRPCSIADWICGRSTLQSLVLWVKESCHLQYDLPFSSCAVGGLYPFEKFNCFSFNNRSNICSTLLTLKSNPFAGPVCFTYLQNIGFAPRVHSATATSCSSLDSSASSMSTNAT